MADSDENQLGTAYGVMQAIQNLGLALTGQISGKLIAVMVCNEHV